MIRSQLEKFLNIFFGLGRNWVDRNSIRRPEPPLCLKATAWANSRSPTRLVSVLVGVVLAEGREKEVYAILPLSRV